LLRKQQIILAVLFGAPDIKKLQSYKIASCKILIWYRPCDVQVTGCF